MTDKLISELADQFNRSALIEIQNAALTHAGILFEGMRNEESNAAMEKFQNMADAIGDVLKLQTPVESKTTFKIYYMKPSWFSDGIMGEQPNSLNLSETHVHLKDLELPGGEAQL